MVIKWIWLFPLILPNGSHLGKQQIANLCYCNHYKYIPVAKHLNIYHVHMRMLEDKIKCWLLKVKYLRNIMWSDDLHGWNKIIRYHLPKGTKPIQRKNCLMFKKLHVYKSSICFKKFKKWIKAVLLVVSTIDCPAKQKGKLKVVKYIPVTSKKQLSVTHNYFSHQ